MVDARATQSIQLIPLLLVSSALSLPPSLPPSSAPSAAIPTGFFSNLLCRSPSRATLSSRGARARVKKRESSPGASCASNQAIGGAPLRLADSYRCLTFANANDVAQPRRFGRAHILPGRFVWPRSRSSLDSIARRLLGGRLARHDPRLCIPRRAINVVRRLSDGRPKQEKSDARSISVRRQ